MGTGNAWNLFFMQNPFAIHPSLWSIKFVTEKNILIIVPLYLFVSICDGRFLYNDFNDINFDDNTHPWPSSKSKFNLKSDRVNLVSPAGPIECLLYLPNVRAMQYKLGPERLTRLGNSNVLRLPVIWSHGNYWFWYKGVTNHYKV